jgi:fused signal recognition particle receptor
MGLLSAITGKFKDVAQSLTHGLTKTREALVTGVRGLRSLLVGKRLDDDLINQIERLLLQADAGQETTHRLVEGLRADARAGKLATGDDALDYLKRSIKALWPPADRSLNSAPPGLKPTVILVTGVNGAGKTTSIAKLCKLLRDEGKTVLLGAADTFRAGAVAQLETWAQRLGVEVVKGQQGGDPAAVAFDACAAAKARGVDVLILDTAGRLHTQEPLMRQLTKIRAVAAKQIEGAPHEVLLVLDATAGQNALRQAREFSAAAGVTGVFLTKLDGTAKGGIVIAVREMLQVPVKFVGVGETPADVAPFDPDAFVEALFTQ